MNRFASRRYTARFRFVFVLGLAGITAGCFHPLYGSNDTSGQSDSGIIDKMRSVEVSKVVALSPTRLPRVAIEVRNNMIFELTGGNAANTSDYKLDISISSSNLAVVVDPSTGLSNIQTYGIDASYRLIEIGTGKPVVTATAFARVTYDIPGQTQRFAGERALRDAENRAARTLAENIRTRLASYFAAGA